MRIVFATAQLPFIQGGVEILAQGLMPALSTHGHEAEIVASRSDGILPSAFRHQFHTAYDLWDHPFGDVDRYPNGPQVREAIGIHARPGGGRHDDPETARPEPHARGGESAARPLPYAH